MNERKDYNHNQNHIQNHRLIKIQEHARNSFGLLPLGYCERKTHKSWKDDI